MAVDPYTVSFSDRDGDSVAVASVEIGGERHIQIVSDGVVQFTPKDAWLLGTMLVSIAEMEM